MPVTERRVIVVVVVVVPPRTLAQIAGVLVHLRVPVDRNGGVLDVELLA